MPLPDIPSDFSENLKIVRQSRIAQNVVFVGGLGACGKTMLTPIVGSLERVEIQKYNYAIEHICTLHYLGRMNDDVATTLIQIQADLDIYNMMMSRETNFRFKDLSSIFKNPGTGRYICRLFQSGDENVPERIEKQKPILHITMHDLMQRAGTLLMALNESVKFINLVRHPLYMIKQWYVYCDALLDKTNDREFSIWYQYQGRSIPWFAFGWEEKYLSSNKMDKVIYLIENHLKHCEGVYNSLSERQKSQILTLSFEKFVLDPFPHMQQIEQLLGTHMTPLTYKEMKKQKVPRKRIADGISRPIYKKYGWKPSQKEVDERQELRIRREFAMQHASREAMEVLDRLSLNYEKRWNIL